MKFLVETDFNSLAVKIYLEDEDGRERRIIGSKDGYLISQTLDRINVTEPILPLLQMPRHMADEFVKAVVDYASNRNIKTENENLLKGKLLATEKHLDDMREFAKKLLDSNLSEPKK
jgi:hypothetical protein